MKLSIVITTRDRKEHLEKCLDSIFRSDLAGIENEIIVVDDFSREKVVADGARVVRNEKQEMMVRSRNIGFENSAGEYILFVDDDNELAPDMIKNLVVAADKNPEYGILGPAMHFLSSKKIYLNYQKFNFFTGKTSGLIDLSEKEIVDSDGVPNVFLIKRTVFEKCGKFDEGLVQTFTEPDFAFNAIKHGFKVGIVKSAITYHDVPENAETTPRSLGGAFKQKAYFLMRNRTVLVTRYGNFPQKIVYLVVFSWFWPVVYSLAMLRFKRFDLIKLYWLGFLDGLMYFFGRNLNVRNIRTD